MNLHNLNTDTIKKNLVSLLFLLLRVKNKEEILD